MEGGQGHAHLSQKPHKLCMEKQYRRRGLSGKKAKEKGKGSDHAFAHYTWPPIRECVWLRVATHSYVWPLINPAPSIKRDREKRK